MGIREQMKEKKSTGLFLGIALIVVGAIVILYQSGGSSAVAPAQSTGNKAYFSTDDGQTYFKDDASNLPPFDSGGKQAVRARVFVCSGAKPFVGYLERFTPGGLKAQQQLDAMKDAKPGPTGPKIDPKTIQTASLGREVKRPGDKAWVPAIGAAGAKVLAIKCPNGKDEASPSEP